MRCFPFLALAVSILPVWLTSCGGGYGRVGLSDAPKVVNVSAYDPKEKQRSGDSFSSSDVSALRRNGVHGLIARTGKGRLIDEKCADFLSAANREGMMLGTYYFVLKDVDAVWQADRYISRLQEIAASRGLQGKDILLVGDFDTKSSPSDMVRFIDRIEQRTGTLPVIYLENSARLRATLSSATPAEKRRIRQCPYWIALYAHNTGFRTPQQLMRAYGIWDEWAMWQYGGVIWQNGRSTPKHYNTGSWGSPRYFGNMAHPMERNVFKGDEGDLRSFWDRHSLAWW